MYSHSDGAVPAPLTPVRGAGGDACPGVLRAHSAADGELVRLRVPGGFLTNDQLSALAAAAERFADGRLSVTSRGNLELRGIGAHRTPQLRWLLKEAGLLPSAPHERMRNIVASPLAGLDTPSGTGLGARVRELDALLRERPRTAELSGRFLFVLDDGRGDVTGLGGDITLMGHGGEAAATRLKVGDETVRIAGEYAARAAVAAAEAFLDARDATGTGAWRVSELPADHPVRLTAALDTAAVPWLPAALPERRTAPLPLGAHPAADGTYALNVAPRLGRLTAAQLRLLRGPRGWVRVTPWRGFVVPGFAPAALPVRREVLREAGLLTDPASPWAGVSACTGLPGCVRAHADVRADAVPATGTGAGARGLPVHWSGCARRCGHPHGDRVDVVATAHGHYEVRVRARGTAQPDIPVTHGTLAERVRAARTVTLPRPAR
ncbi:precorrin-3B synthase [Streptomyces sp. NPDC004111]|uniref:precorrin-3B synthase n=1 Tax=Streptomyces sp. NPDC004111 TaxID=3364690 RepID=UPI00369D6CDC